MSEETLTQLDAELDASSVDSIPIPAPNAPEPMSMGAVLRVVTMRRLWYAQIVSVFGDFLALFAVITVMTFKLHASRLPESRSPTCCRLRCWASSAASLSTAGR